MFSKLFTFAIMCLALSTLQAAAERRVALVIGNSAYEQVAPLENAAQDARDVARALRDLGVEVHSGIDLTRIEMLRLVDGVMRELKPTDIAMFYFAGHGVQIGAENFVIPVDAGGATAAELRRASVSLQSVLREMEMRADRNIVILDACRNNPFTVETTGRSVGGTARGLARVDAGVGSYIAFSTQPGNVALDGAGRNSPFTAALLRHLPGSNDDLHELMRKVRSDVVAETDSQQIPWENSSLIDQIFLGGSASATSQPAATTATLAPTTTTAALAPAPLPSRFRHVVAGLDPNGDGFLALRTGTTSAATRLAKMTEGTGLEVLEQRGVWFRVNTDTGLSGWAHSNWIRFRGAGTPTQATAAAAPTCDTLWHARNSIFAARGYCFQSARGKAAFGHLACTPGLSAGAVPLTGSERAQIDRIKGQERAMGC